MVGLNKNELKVFKKLTLNPQSVAEIARATKMPRMTVYTNLQRLEKMKLVQKVRSESKKRFLWIKKSKSALEEEVSSFANKILSERMRSVAGASEYFGKKEVGDALMKLTVQKDGARMYSVQSSKNWEMWVTLMGKDWVNKHNRAVVKHKLIALTIHSEEAPLSIRSDKDIIESYKGRLGNSHAIREEFLPKGLSLYIFEHTILLVDLEKVRALSLTDQGMSLFLIKMFVFMFEKAGREEFFQKFNR